MLISYEIKSVALAVLNLGLSEALVSKVSKSVSQ